MNQAQALKQYRAQHGSSRARGIKWELSFAQWCLWWISSGHYHQRGRGPGHYSMARIDASGTFSLGNIACVANEQVTHEFWHGTRRSGAVAHNRSLAQARRRRIHTPHGEFESLTQASHSIKHSTSGIRWRMQHHPEEYYYIT